MLLFSTILDINEKLTRAKFVDLILEWNENQQFPEENRIPDLKWNGQYGVKTGSENLWICFEEYKSIVAVRYEKRGKDGIVWDTDYVMNFRNMKMAIRLERSYAEDALTLDGQFSAPYFISLLIDKGYLKKDNNLHIQRGPTFVNSDNISLATDVICGRIKYRNPVVYVSKSFQNEDPVDVTAMSKKLRGMAHVLVQEDLSLNKEMQAACSGKNEYRGSIGIYFPNATAGHKTLRYRREVGQDPQLMEKVIESVLRYANSQIVDPLFTWQGVNNALLLERFEAQRNARSELEEAYRRSEAERANMANGLSEEGQRIAEEARAKAESEAYELLAQFDEDERRLRKQIEDLTKANEDLQRESDILRNKVMSQSKTPLLYRGREKDFYEGEVREMVLAALEDSLGTMTSTGRRRDIVKDIIDSNEYQKVAEQKSEDIRRLLKTYTGMTAKLRQELETMGFVIGEDGKHYKVTYFGDPRYCVTLSKTPSDWRAGQAITSEFKKAAF